MALMQLAEPVFYQNFMKRLATSFLVCALALGMCHAEIKLPNVIGSNMVLQRNDNVALWGKATPDSKVKITTEWNGRKYTAQAGADGKWNTRVETGEAGGPYQITISDGKAVTLDNILLGEVWICGGQSNMDMPVCGDATQPAEGSYEALRTVKDYPNIRMFTVPRNDTDMPLDSCGGEWLISVPANVRKFSAVAYYFARTMQDFIDVPVGLVVNSYGGSSIEAWMTEECLKSIEGADLAASYSVQQPRERPQRLWNAMLCPLVPYTAKGFLWYQGEANIDRWYDYAKMQQAQIALWRNAWGREDMPFYITQIAPYSYPYIKGDKLPLLIEQQYQAAASTPKCEIVATTDLGNRDCIHPAKKREVGERLAWLALKNDYGIDGLPKPAPTFHRMKMTDKGELMVIFNNVDAIDSFVYYDDNGDLAIQGFEIAGEDKVFHPAKVRTNVWSNKLYLSSPEVPNPIAVRYAFRNFVPEANLRTNYGQPVPPFRTDTWETEMK